MKLRMYAALLTLFLALGVTTVYATGPGDKDPRKEIANWTDEQKTARMEEIRGRVNEIKAMEFSTLSKGERKALKKELKGMKKEARAMSGGVYLSVGAIIVIILVLILIL
jgi:hypothetical protein